VISSKKPRSTSKHLVLSHCHGFHLSVKRKHDVGVVKTISCHVALHNLTVFPLPLTNSILNRLVLETLEPLSEDRKCFRLINGVLVERTVKDVVPALKTNQEGLRKVLEDLVKQYKTKQDDLEKWKVS
jgi:hypothetical protein